MKYDNFASAPLGGDNAQRIVEFSEGTQSNQNSSSTTKDFPVALKVGGGVGALFSFTRWMVDQPKEKQNEVWKILLKLSVGGLAIYAAVEGIKFGFKKAATKNAQKEDNQATHSEQLVAEGQSPSQVPSMTGAAIKAAAKNAPKPQFLLDGIIKEGSICMLLAPEKIGKSTFIMQFVDALSKGERFCLPVNQYKHAPTDVLYYDFELDRDDYADRYGNSSTMDKIELVRKKDWVSIDAWLSDIEEKVSASTNHKVVVVDTMSSIVGNDDESAKVINRRIKALKDTMASKGIFISFIFVCHTIKDYESWKPITAKDIRGSQLLTGLADTTLALEPTKLGNNHIMFKQIDSRKTGLEEQAFLLERVIEPGNWHFCFKKMVNEQENLPNKNGQNESTMQEQGAKESKEERNARWQKMYDEGMTCEEIEKKEGVTRQTVSNNINTWRGKGRKKVENKDCNGQGTK